MKIAIGLLQSCGNANASIAVVGSSSKNEATGNGVGGGETMVRVYGTSVMIFNVYVKKIFQSRFVTPC